MASAHVAATMHHHEGEEMPGLGSTVGGPSGRSILPGSAALTRRVTNPAYKRSFKRV